MTPPQQPCPSCGHADANHEPTGRGICDCCSTEAARRAAGRKRIDDHLPVGTAISPGHPANAVRWFRTERGWIDQRGHPVPDDANFYDIIGHGGYWLLQVPQ